MRVAGRNVPILAGARGGEDEVVVAPLAGPALGCPHVFLHTARLPPSREPAFLPSSLSVGSS